METKYQIEVSALGYDTTKTVIVAKNIAEAKKSQYKAISEWITHNDVDRSTAKLASIRYLVIN